MTKAAILIDGGFFIKRLPAVKPDVTMGDTEQVANAIQELVYSHLDYLKKVYSVSHRNQLLYRTFYYDATPYDQKAHQPVSNRSLDFAVTAQARFRKELFLTLHRLPNLAVRLGEVKIDRNNPWVLKQGGQKDLLNGQRSPGELTDEDFSPALRQKGVDMRIGLDIASITLKKQADIIILVSGDADFVPAAKMARREGVKFVLDPLWHHISDDLEEHIDQLRSGFPKPNR
ncbi:MAG: NYN domain-containing protein [Gammaproteobacteria bacterium]|nr:NYN domain-containing protein [Gammaproteobacteria bacterium]MYD76942.1 NYN domain-containing protein [Gammaproteobacteria bacterium]MYJ51860.1 NYN domain-containing protein [Gammaproteobacteria bacterium]